MAGHNKWSKIKRKKAANDVARARDHTRAARAIESASLACQGDLSDMHLQSTIGAARAVQLPKERIDKAIDRGANPDKKSEGMEYVTRLYHGMIPTGSSGKVAVIVETLTENRNRTAANVRHLVTKTGGELLPTGSNDWLFQHAGLIWISKYMKSDDGSTESSNVELDEDELIDCALENNAIDVEFMSDAMSEDNEDDEYGDNNNYAMIKCEPNEMLQIVQALKEEGFKITQFEKQWLVKDEDNRVLLDTESAEKFDKFLNSMDDDLDVTNVFHNSFTADDA